MHHKGERSQHSNQAASDHNQMGAVTLFATNPTVSTPAAHISVYYKSLIFIKSALALWVCRQGTTSASAHRVSEGRPQCFLFIGGKALSVCLHYSIFLTTARGSPSHNMRVDARHRRLAAVPRDLARTLARHAFCYRKNQFHYIKTTRVYLNLRFDNAAKSVPWPSATARLAGSTKFDRPQKRKRFWGARTSPTRRR